ncbi:hypothetical protein LPJ64_000653 [Coemansia asiatica]|uniref:Uncharacterized protein n=1 Tax=Coemansia asiatica TaxID=1052880 RepID=A0A9W7XS76_9FUNG|nr:hypothetical protein LPJ64_000653 [Coemansia asiatica]
MTDIDGVDDIHGFFQFAQLSDSDTDDGLFAKPRSRTVPFDASKINYFPKLDEESWYDHSKTKTLKAWLSEHFGLDEITYTAQRWYSKKRYLEAAELCRETAVEFVEKYRDNLRMAAIREILEIGCRSAMHLDIMEEVEFFYGMFLKCGGMNPGYNRFLAEALIKMQRFEEALEQLVAYLVQRKQDARIWEMIGLTLMDIGRSNDFSKQNNPGDLVVVWRRLALGAFCKAWRIIEGCKTWAQTEVAVRQKQIQTGDLRRSAMCAMEMVDSHRMSSDRLILGDDWSEEQGLFWLKCKEESAVDQCQIQNIVQNCSPGLQKSVRWVLENLDKDQGAGIGDESDEDDAKNVDEL